MAIHIRSEEEEYKKVLNNDFLMDLLLEGYGAEPIDEYGSYMKVPNKCMKQMLNWLRQQEGYYEMLLGYTPIQEEEEKQETVDTGISQFDELEQRISHLEYLLKHLKDKKDRKEKEMKIWNKEDGVEGSGSNF